MEARHKNLWNAGKATLVEKFIALNADTGKENTKMNSLKFFILN